MDHSRSRRRRPHDDRYAVAKYICSLLLLVLVCSCDKSPTTSTFSGVQMTIPYYITVGSPLNPIQADQIASIIETTFDEINTHCNNYNPASEISQINNAPAGTPYPLSPTLEYLLQKTSELYTRTNGRFDPTIAPLYKLWKQSLEQGAVPSPSSVQKILPAIGWHNLHIENHTLTKKHAETQVDLGGIAKGYAIDLLTERLVEAGYSHVLIDWGGDMRAHGSHPAGRPWTVAVLNPDDPSDLSSTKILHDEAIATSGNYLQYWETDQGTFTHIINPQTHAPLKKTNAQSVTITAPTCLEADALATAAFISP